MAAIVLITNAWGAKSGGINTFNTDLARAIGTSPARPAKVLCLVLAAAPEETADAKRSGVALVPLGRPEVPLDKARSSEILALLKDELRNELSETWWLGHDVLSGEVAVALASATSGRSAAIHHMSYIDYQTYKHGVGAQAKEKFDRQRVLFADSARRIAVGPLLRDRLANMLRCRRDEVTMLIPGLAGPDTSPPLLGFRAITFGRLDPTNDRVKQGRLAVAAFASAARRAHAEPALPHHLRNGPQLLFIGIAAPGGAEEAQIYSLAQQRAGRVLSIVALPYLDQEVAMAELRGSALAMMLSWHEGFGLTGWEAIAAGVPLLVSKQSGLYQLVDELLGAPGTACLVGLDVRGHHGTATENGSSEDENFDPQDEADAADAILRVAANLERARRNSGELRRQLLAHPAGCTWEHAARALLDALWPPLRAPVTESLALAAPPPPGQAGATTGSAVAQRGSKGRRFDVPAHFDSCLCALDGIARHVFDAPWPPALTASKYKQLLDSLSLASLPVTLESFLKAARDAIANPAPTLLARADWNYFRESIEWLAPGISLPERNAGAPGGPDVFADSSRDGDVSAALGACEMFAQPTWRTELTPTFPGWPRHLRNVLLKAYAVSARVTDSSTRDHVRGRIGAIAQKCRGST